MSLISAFATNWLIANQDTDEVIEGDFEAQDVSRSVSSTFTEHFSLSRQSPITQFLHGNVTTLSFTGRFFVDPAILSITGLPFAGPVPALLGKTPGNRYSLRPSEKMSKLEAWAGVDPELQRPPVVLFSIGNGELSQISLIEQISDIRYDRPMLTGEIRGCTFTVHLRQFIPFDMEKASQPPPESRWHHTRTGDYYELIAESEYGFPLLGDVVRKRNADKSIIHEGDTIKFPSLGAIQNTSVVPRSIALTGFTTDVQGPQRTLHQTVLDRHNKTLFSTIVPEGL